MESFGSFLSALPEYVVIIGILVTGLVAGFGIFDARSRQRRKDENDIEDRVIKLLKEQNEALTQKINDYEGKFTVLNEKVAKVEAQNTLMREILSGRDDDTVERNNRADIAMQTVGELAKVATANGKKTDAVMQAIKQTNSNVERLAKAIEKHLDVEAKYKLDNV